MYVNTIQYDTERIWFLEVEFQAAQNSGVDFFVARDFKRHRHDSRGGAEYPPLDGDIYNPRLCFWFFCRLCNSYDSRPLAGNMAVSEEREVLTQPFLQ